ncbi:hypothetical protein [Shewanella sp. 1180_01]|uniref:hypothetical protein n=1 Tax=Shewanella sp. 1180_01 TaxID=2604451 RepID=UPI004064BEBD
MIRNYAYSGFSFSFRLVANTVVYLIAARIYGPVLFGELSIALLAGSILTLVSDLGVHQRFFKSVAITDDVETKENINLKFLFTIFCIVCLIISFIFSINYVVLLVGMSFIINAYYDFILTDMRAKGKFADELKFSLLNNMIFTSLCLFAVLSKSSLTVFAFCIFISRVLSFTFIIYKLRLSSYFSLSYCWSFAILSKQFSYTVDFLLTNVWQVLDGYLVSLYYNSIFGIYSSYTRITNGLSTLSAVVVNVIFREIANEAKVGKHKSLLIGTAFFIVISFLLFWLLSVFDKYLILAVLGEEYVAYSYLLPLMFVPISLKWISSCLGIYMVVTGRIKKRVVVQLLGLTAFFALTIFGLFYGLDISIIVYGIILYYSIVLLGYLFLFLRIIK